jgi:DNA-directed RNA polymerase beta' subunit
LYDNVSFHAEKPEKKSRGSLNKEFTIAQEMKELNQLTNKKRITLNPSDVEKYIKKLWQNEVQIFSSIYAFEGACSDIFFLHIVPVMPNKFRPMMKVGANVYENAMNSFLSKIIELNNALTNELEQSKVSFQIDKELMLVG